MNRRWSGVCRVSHGAGLSDATGLGQRSLRGVLRSALGPLGRTFGPRPRQERRLEVAIMTMRQVRRQKLSLSKLGLGLGSLLGLCGSLLLQMSPAQAYVRSRTRSCNPVHWSQSCLYVQLDGNLAGPDQPADEIESATQSAIASWNDRLQLPSFISLRYLPPSGPKEVNQLDGLQLIKFRRDTWCRPATSTGQATCFDSSAAAVTTVTFLNRPNDPALDGQIIDADIEMNAVSNHFYNVGGAVPEDGRVPVDLWNTLTHELGHVLGLEHTCDLGNLSACVVDEHGQPVPSCSTVERAHQTQPAYRTTFETTMYPTAVPGEIMKRVPRADDVAGVVNAYPKVQDPGVCRLPYGVSVAGCGLSDGRSTSSSATGAAMGAGLGLLLLLWRRRCRVTHRSF